MARCLNNQKWNGSATQLFPDLKKKYRTVVSNMRLLAYIWPCPMAKKSSATPCKYGFRHHMSYALLCTGAFEQTTHTLSMVNANEQVPRKLQVRHSANSSARASEFKHNHILTFSYSRQLTSARTHASFGQAVAVLQLSFQLSRIGFNEAFKQASNGLQTFRK